MLMADDTLTFNGMLLAGGSRGLGCRLDQLEQLHRAAPGR